jgi:hypothetical protein
VPQLQRVIAVYSGPGGNSQVEEGNTLADALSLVFQGLTIPSPAANGSSPSRAGAPASAQVQSDIAQVAQDFQQAQNDLKAGDFAAYGTDIANLQSAIQLLQQASGTSSSSSSSTSTSSTPSSSTTTTTTLSGVASSSSRTSVKVPSSVALGPESH